jgi:hypothetical protein
LVEIDVEINGDEQTIAKLKKFPAKTKRYFASAGKEAAAVVLATTGIQKYPRATSANRPPTPYYIRGRGTQYQSRNTGSSERYGTKWTVKNQGYRTIIGNTASYARYLGGRKQARAMGRLGWQKLFDVAKAKLPQVRKIYSWWLERAIRDLGLA